MRKRLDYNQIAPEGLEALGGIHGYIAQSSLPATLVDLVYLRVSQINNCAYCLDTHTRDLLRKGQSVEKLALVQAWQARSRRPLAKRSTSSAATSRSGPHA